MSDHNRNITTILKSAENEETRDAKAFVDPRLPETDISDTEIGSEFAKAASARATGDLQTKYSSPERVQSVDVKEVLLGFQ